MSVDHVHGITAYLALQLLSNRSMRWREAASKIRMQATIGIQTHRGVCFGTTDWIKGRTLQIRIDSDLQLHEGVTLKLELPDGEWLAHGGGEDPPCSLLRERRHHTGHHPHHIPRAQRHEALEALPRRRRARCPACAPDTHRAARAYGLAVCRWPEPHREVAGPPRLPTRLGAPSQPRTPACTRRAPTPPSVHDAHHDARRIRHDSPRRDRGKDPAAAGWFDSCCLTMPSAECRLR